MINNNRIIVVVLLLFCLFFPNYQKDIINFIGGKPSVSEQENLFSEEIKKLDIHEIKESKRKFLKNYYVVTYEYPNAVENKESIKKLLFPKFNKNEWSYINERPKVSDAVVIRFTKKEYSCEVRLYKNIIDLSFVYDEY